MRLSNILDERRHKTVLAAAVLVFLVMEVAIFLAAESASGLRTRLVVTAPDGAKVYETRGASLEGYERMAFERTFGPLDRYRVRVVSENVPFPVVGWISAAVGFPVGLVLLAAFTVRAYLTLAWGDDKPEAEGSAARDGGRLSLVMDFFRRVSVFHIGGLVVLGALLLWLVPAFLKEFAAAGLGLVREFKWFFAGAAVFAGVFLAWVVHLRYRLSRQMLMNQFELERTRIERTALLAPALAPLLPHVEGDAAAHPSEAPGAETPGDADAVLAAGAARARSSRGL